MKKELSASMARVKEDNTREEGLLGRISEALEKANIAGGYTRLQVPNLLNDSLFVCGEDWRFRTSFLVAVEKGNYSIEMDKKATGKTPMSSAEIAGVEGQTHDYNTFMGALGYILSIHYPSAVENGRLARVMKTFERPDGVRPAPAGGVSVTPADFTAIDTYLNPAND